ncbi:glycosyl transferase [Tilletia horrida]|uniref:Dolichyl pyrophosphate Glc1Man9GlcNAc2 alpha-1,3-glucosyltransferase n=1 Tax=Tilletia horrida TaxID=155126 RepID=A0AAN6GNV1_9BASI|nr:glycosyl transferase [Tilletia horrida]KAK0565584.1 glycosyl transferase [Tilletia horrida]
MPAKSATAGSRVSSGSGFGGSGGSGGSGLAGFSHGSVFFSPLAPLFSLIPAALRPSQTQIDLLLLSTVIKVLLYPTYHSTDFEVHRNWLAITHSLPLRKWYFDAGSQWTLDYPPFFAYFSYLLGIPNRWLGWGDQRITQLVEGLELANSSTKFYMRTSVIVTELVLGAALVALSRAPRQVRLHSSQTERTAGDETLQASHSSQQIPSSRQQRSTSISGSSNVPDSATQLPPSIRLLGKKPSRPNFGPGGALDFNSAAATLLAASIFFHPGLIIIDHIHFQYNGFLFGVLLWAIWAARERRLLLCAVLFSSLLNLKHIYVYIAPAFTIFLLRTYVIPPGAESKLGTHPDIFFLAIERLLGLALVTLIPFAFSIGPLIFDVLANGRKGEPGVGAVLGQVLSRLFPFSRGLNHAYWAPNAWALWTFADRVALKLLRRRPSLAQFLPIFFSRNLANASAVESASRGLVGDTTFAVLPNIAPSVCFALTLLAMLPFLAYLWVKPSYRRFLAALTGCGFASFLFGWHVHEKAILLILIPFTPLAVQSYTHFRIWTLLSAAGIVSLFPLLYEVRETPIKIGYAFLWALMVGLQLKSKVFRPVPSNLGLIMHFLEDIYLLGLIPLQVYVDVVHPMLFPSASTTAIASSGVAASASAAAAPIVSAALSAGQPIITPLKALEEVVAEAVGSITAAAGAAVAAVATSTVAYDTSSSRATGVAGAAASAVVSPLRDAIGGFNTFSSSSDNSLEFLPLMLTSVYCAVGVCWAWVRLGWACWTCEGEETGAVGGIEGGESLILLEGSNEEEEAGDTSRLAGVAEADDQSEAINGVSSGVMGGAGITGRHHHHHHLGHQQFASEQSPSPNFGGHPIVGLGQLPRMRPPSEDARSYRSTGSVRSNAARLRRQSQQDAMLSPPEGLPMPVRRRKVTATGATAAATAAAAAAAAASGSHHPSQQQNDASRIRPDL